MRRVVFLLCTLLSVAAAQDDPASRPPKLDINLREALQMALGKNFEIRSESFSPLIAEQRRRIESGRFDPRIELSYSRDEDTDRTLIDAEGRPVRSIDRTDSAFAGVAGETPLGTSYDVGVQSVNSRGTANKFTDSYTTGLAFGLRQPLLQGFGPAATLSGIRIARLNVRGSEWQLRQQIIDVITEIYFVYNDLYFNMQNLEVARRSQGLARQLYEDNRRRVDIGTMSPLDITTARAAVARRQEAVILALASVQDNENFLKQLISGEIETLLRTRVVITPPPTAASFKPNIEQGIRNALTWRPDYQQALLELQRRKITLAFERNQALPRLDLTGSLDLLGLDRDFSRSLGNSVARDRTSWNAGAIFSVPIPNRAGSGRTTAAQLESARALVELKRLEQEIVVRVDNAARQIVTAIERIKATSESSVLAQESLDAGQERLRLGSATTFEVLELQSELAEAEVAELRARTDYNKAVSEYDRVTGTAIERNGLVIDR